MEWSGGWGGGSKKRTNDSESDGTAGGGGGGAIAIFTTAVVALLLRFIHSGAVERWEYFFFVCYPVRFMRRRDFPTGRVCLSVCLSVCLLPVMSVHLPTRMGRG